jgi:hypothetical protein
MSTKFWDLYAIMVQGRYILMSILRIAGYKILRFWANPQKYQTVPTKSSHLKVEKADL